MIELALRTDEGPITVQIDAPVARPDDSRWPWQIEVRLNGRATTLVVGEEGGQGDRGLVRGTRQSPCATDLRR